MHTDNANFTIEETRSFYVIFFVLFRKLQMYIEQYQISQQHYMHTCPKLPYDTQSLLRMYDVPVTLAHAALW